MSVERTILVQTVKGRTEVLVIEDGQAVEYLIDQDVETGQLYKGRVTDVLDSLGACFVDLGLERPAYLELENEGERRRGEHLIVQVERGAEKEKGAKVTTNVKLAGRLLVYMPYGEEIKLSMRLVEDGVRRRLQHWAGESLHPGEGVILRTQAREAKAEELNDELNKLRQEWKMLVKQAERYEAPARLKRNDGLIEQVSRDFFNENLQQCVVDNPGLFKKWESWQEKYPQFSFKLSIHEDKQPLFEAKGFSQEIKQLYQRKIRLKSGGSIVFDETEALTVIDVNTGGSFQASLEEAAYLTNREAAWEAARQIRLRDIGGIIIIDFVSLSSERMKKEILATLSQALAADRKETHLLGYTPLGLVELTRKKTNPSLWQRELIPCSVCHGRGRMIQDA